jgi:hypothetical protein
MLSQGKRAREGMLAAGSPPPECLLGLISAIGRVDSDRFTAIALDAPSTVRARLPLSVLRVSPDVCYFEVEVLEYNNESVTPAAAARSPPTAPRAQRRGRSSLADRALPTPFLRLAAAWPSAWPLRCCRPH